MKTYLDCLLPVHGTFFLFLGSGKCSLTGDMRHHKCKVFAILEFDM
jgi:hypothetical protein